MTDTSTKSESGTSHFQVIRGQEALAKDTDDVIVAREYEHPAQGRDVWLMTEEEAEDLVDRLQVHLQERENDAD